MFSRIKNKQMIILIAFTCFSIINISYASSKTGTITGIVTDSATGQPILGVSVLVVGKTIGAKTDSAGTYHIKKVPMGTHSLKIIGIGYFSATIDSVTVVTSKTIAPSTALKKHPLVDSGKTIVVSCTNYPIPESVTTVDQLLTQVAGVVQDSNGQFFIRKGKAGEVGYILDYPFPSNPLGGFGEQVDAGKALEATPANLGPTGTITGIITDSANGSSIVGAHVCVLEAALGGKTDSAGVYVIPNVPIGTYRLIVGTPDYLVSDMPSVTVVADSTITISQKLPKRVTDTNIRSKIKITPDTTK